MFSIFGIVFLLVLGALYQANAEVLTTGHDAPKDAQATGQACYIAAAIYAGVLVLGIWQYFLARRREAARAHPLPTTPTIN